MASNRSTPFRANSGDEAAEVYTNRGKQLISLLLLGHSGAGKSTTAGQLICKSGSIDERMIQKLEEETQNTGKNSLKLSWILDRLRGEREKGVTIETGLWKVDTQDRVFTLIDAPGHKDYTPNLIAGVSQGDCGVILVSSNEKGDLMDVDQTNEHIVLAWSFGIKQIIVCVNKMDAVEYSEKIFSRIKEQVSALLKKVGYKPEQIPFIPISGWTGDNVVESSPKMRWYTGQSLLESMKTLKAPVKLPQRPLRIPLSNVYQIDSVGTLATGRVETGKLLPGQVVKIAPSMAVTQIQWFKYAEANEEMGELSEAYPGENLVMNFGKLSMDDIRPGYVVGDAKNKPPAEATEIIANIVILNHSEEIRVGYTPVVHCGCASVACRIEEILSKNDRVSWKKIESNPQSLKSGDAAVVKLIPSRPFCVESYNECKPLSSLVLRDMNQTIAVGMAKTVKKKEDDSSAQSF